MHASAAAERATWDGVMRLVDPKITLASAASLRLSYRGLGELTVALAPLLGAPRLVWSRLLRAPFGVAAWRRLANDGSNTRRVVMAQRWSLSAFLLMSAGSALGLVEG